MDNQGCQHCGKLITTGIYEGVSHDFAARFAFELCIECV